MRLPAPFIKLPLRFDTARLKAEVEQFDESEWRGHPQGFAGNSALILVSHLGGENDDTAGAMLPTPRLKHCAYLRQVLASFETVVGRSRLMRLEPGAEVTPHSDIDYYWHDRVRIHVPIVTDTSVRFNCDGVEINMAEGEAWIFDNWRPHRVINGSGIRRIHLVIDTVGSAAFWRLVSRGSMPNAASFPPPVSLPYIAEASGEVPLESHNVEHVAHPAVVKMVVHELLADLRTAQRGSQEAALEAGLADFANQWQALWAMYGDASRGYTQYASLIDDLLRQAGHQSGAVRLPSNGMPAALVLQKYLPGFFGARDEWYASVAPPKFERPVIIVSAPRSGSTLLFEMLARHPALLTLGDESHAEVENVPGLAPRDRGYVSNALQASDASPEISMRLLKNFAFQLRDHAGQRWIAQEPRVSSVRFLEKTPKNALRIPFLGQLFPDALFIFLYRDSAPNLGSMLDAWASGRFVTYADLPGWTAPPWSLLLPPGWQALRGRPLAETVAWQWQSANAAILDALTALPASRWRVLDYASLLKDPAGVFTRACSFMDVPAADAVARELAGHGLPNSRYTLTAPAADKWRRHQAQLEPVLPGTAALMQRLTALDNRL